jgi:2,3-bisphosphoglycerate-independent phosphoglycerate mutase
MLISQKPIMPTTLLILDGWGEGENSEFNAIYKAHTDTWDKLYKKYPHTLIEASGREVGLPDGQMGNSEVGHLNLGAGRIVYQDLTRVGLSIEDNSFFNNPTLTQSVERAVAQKNAIHIMGLLSPGGVHSHEGHFIAMLQLAARHHAKEIYIHAFLDGRDTPPKSAGKSLELFEKQFKELGVGCFASITGRYYAMDRDRHWNRVRRAYDTIAGGKAKFKASTAEAALNLAYERGETDEFVQPTLIIPEGQESIHVKNNDTIIFMNIRADRARQLTAAFTQENFLEFKRAYVPQSTTFICLTEYSGNLGAPVAYPPTNLENVFSEYISKHKLHQLHIAETEKYAHVTFFFNGGREIQFEYEERQLIPSPRVATYDLQPEMSASTLTESLVDAVYSDCYDFIICNYANADMVGHTGNFRAAIHAIEELDKCLKKIVDAHHYKQRELLITADHGNAEKMWDVETQQPHTAHTTNPVPCIYIGKRPEKLRTGGRLCDIAPTLLHIMNLPQPIEMSGKNLLYRQKT